MDEYKDKDDVRFFNFGTSQYFNRLFTINNAKKNKQYIVYTDSKSTITSEVYAAEYNEKEHRIDYIEDPEEQKLVEAIVHKGQSTIPDVSVKKEGDFQGTITNQVVQSKKINFGRKIRTLTIADLHGYTSKPELTVRLAEAIKREEPDIIFIAGDLFNGGKPWEGGEKLDKCSIGQQNISEVAPVCVTWGNHDLRGVNARNHDERLGNLRNLENVRPGRVYPLYNDKVFINGMEIIGYVPRFELMEGPGLRTQIHGVAHDEFMADYERDGVKFNNAPEVLNVFLGHDPHLIAASENGVGLGSLSVCDYFITGHLHGGYEKVVRFLDRIKKQLTGRGFASLNADESLKYDRGWTDQPGRIVDKNGKPIPRHKLPVYLGSINLCRGIVYIDSDAQQRFLQLADGSFYRNASNEPNTQVWQKVLEDSARSEILENNLSFMLISEGISPAFLTLESAATFNVVDIEGTQRRR